ncbi:PUS4 [Candida margitis]|uniref:PUS4 n=1 Tax=Candida margitis TaxID=1775924 RepID=UPI00222742CE|nr:PUS4 [Candida margitis]KAI5967990.1 PUS4 [Candida margitis]
MKEEHRAGFVDDKYNLSNEAEDPDLVFFNYHEFLAPIQQRSQPSLVINHFPNYYADRSTSTFYKTRIVKIPRLYDTTPYSDLIPRFSTVYPGREQGAIKVDGESSVATGLYDGNVFGTTSEIVGFEDILSEEELLGIVNTINRILYSAFYPFQVATLIENILEVLTGGLFIQILNLFNVCTHTKRKVLELEQFVENINDKLQTKDVAIISPRKTGYLSLCDLQELFTKSKAFAPDLKAMKEKVLYDLSRDKKWKSRAQKKANSTKIKIGHGGTLDPMASGVLVVGVGLGTKKLQYYLSECQKTYETKALLGISTTTGDAEGEIITQTKTDHITPELVKSTVEKFVGDIKQTPPIFSALKVNGKPLYEYARKGLPLPTQIKVRDVRVNDIKVIEDDLLSTDHEFKKLESELDENGVPKEHGLMNNPTLNDSPLYYSKEYLEKMDSHEGDVKPMLQAGDEHHPEKLPLIHFISDVSSGTYIRSLISDIGRALASSAYMVELIRVKQSEWQLDKNVFRIEDFQKSEDVWGPILKKVLDQGGKDIDLAAEFAVLDTQPDNTKEDGKGDLSSPEAPRGEKRLIDEVE